MLIYSVTSGLMLSEAEALKLKSKNVKLKLKIYIRKRNPKT